MAVRQLEFTQEIADIICERLADGESLRSICRDDDMPSTVTICKWLGRLPDFANQYARARELQADAMFDDCLDIANRVAIGVTTITKASGVEVHEGDMLNHRRLQIDVRKWAAGKLRPKKYGDIVGREPTPEPGRESRVRVEGALPGEFDE